MEKMSEETRTDTRERLLAGLLIAKNELAELRKKYDVLQAHAVTVTSLHATTEVETTVGLVQPDRSTVLSTLTWRELMSAAHRINTADACDHLENARLYPDLYEGVVVDDVLLLTQPYLTYHKELTLSIDRAIQDIMVGMRKQPVGNTRLFTGIRPSEWVVDFLQIFDRAERVGVEPYPGFRQMEEYFYRTEKASVLTTTGTSMMNLRTYPTDIVYHTVRFASLFTTMVFEADDQMIKSTYTDIEVMVHYSMRVYEKGTHYPAFLRRPSDYTFGSNWIILTEAVTLAARQIKNVMHKGLYFRVSAARGSTPSVELVRETVRDDGNKVFVVAEVPSEIMAGLRLDILRNILQYRRRVALSVTGDVTLQEESPIGRLLNFDKNAVKEFTRMYSDMNYSDPTLVQGQLLPGTATLRCVHGVFALLVSVVGSLYGLKKPSESLDPCILLARCMRYDTESDVVRYASSTEAMPGLLFYTMIASESRIDSREFFKGRPDKISFCNAFGTYAALVAPIATKCEDIRWMDTDCLDQVRASAGKDLQVARASYLNQLMFYAHYKEKGAGLMDYFKNRRPVSASTKSLVTPLNLRKNYTNDYTFYTNPIVFGISYEVVESRKPVRPVVERVIQILQPTATDDDDVVFIPTK